MYKILVVGNVIRDVYLNFDPEEEGFEEGAGPDLWLDLAFSGQKFEHENYDPVFEAGRHHYFKEEKVLAGAEISRDVLEKMGVEAVIVGSQNDAPEKSERRYSGEKVKGALAEGLLSEEGNAFSRDIDERFILVADEKTCYFSPRKRKATIFEEPKEEIGMIYVDPSANLSDGEARKIGEFCERNKTRLVIYLKKNDAKLLQLAKRANLTFAEEYVPELDRTRQIVISRDKISFGNIEEQLNLGRSGLMTALSLKSTIAATILGGIVSGKNLKECFSLAKMAAEGEKLDRNLCLKEIDDRKMMSNNTKLAEIVKMMLAPGKGILAADESGGSIKKKFAQLEIADTYENRRDYRNLFFSAPGLERYAGGVILFDETARQFADDGRNFVDYLTAKGVIPGVKVDKGLEKYGDSSPSLTTAGFEIPEELKAGIQPEETWTRGLEGLSERLKEYAAMGLKFTKWRAAFEVNLSEKSKNFADEGSGGSSDESLDGSPDESLDGSPDASFAESAKNEILTPSAGAIYANAEILARYAKKVQEAGMVPIVEPELVYDGDYGIETSKKLTGEILDELFERMRVHDVDFSGAILKVNMVLAGKKSEKQSSSEEVGEATARVLLEHVPKELGGVVFLSGGQGPEQATENLREIIKSGRNLGGFPWPVTFSFARALQDPALFAWKGDNKNAEEAKEAFFERLKANSEALKSS